MKRSCSTRLVAGGGTHTDTQPHTDAPAHTHAHTPRRIQRGAPDAEAAIARLQALRAKVLEFSALLAVGEGPERGPNGPVVSPVVEVVMNPLDGSEVQVPDEGHWVWAVSQMKLDQEQVIAFWRSGVFNSLGVPGFAWIDHC